MELEELKSKFLFNVSSPLDRSPLSPPLFLFHLLSPGEKQERIKIREAVPIN